MAKASLREMMGYNFGLGLTIIISGVIGLLLASFANPFREITYHDPDYYPQIHSATILQLFQGLIIFVTIVALFCLWPLTNSIRITTNKFKKDKKFSLYLSIEILQIILLIILIIVSIIYAVASIKYGIASNRLSVLHKDDPSYQKLRVDYENQISQALTTSNQMHVYTSIILGILVIPVFSFCFLRHYLSKSKFKVSNYQNLKHGIDIRAFLNDQKIKTRTFINGKEVENGDFNQEVETHIETHTFINGKEVEDGDFDLDFDF